MALSRPVAGVIGSGIQPYSEIAHPLGHWLAGQGFHLVTGGGGGVMEAVSQGFHGVEGRPGRVIGILPAAGPCTMASERAEYRPPPGYPNRFVELAIRTHLHLTGPAGMDPASRNHIVVLTSDVVIALPGAEGTRSEIRLALEYRKPLWVLNHLGVWDEFAGSGAHLVQNLEELQRGIFRWRQGVSGSSAF